MDLYNFKHNREAEVRDYKAPAAPKPVPPTSLKIGDGELKFGGLVQGWYLADDTAGASNTFRVRRTEIKLSGKITPSWGFEVMLDPSKTQSSTAGGDGKILQDAAVAYLGFKGHELSLGQKKVSLTEEGTRSSSELDFAERSQITRAIADRREAGLFYKGEYGEHFGAQVSITNGTANNVNDDSNDTVVLCGKVDAKPVKGFVFGGSGCSSGGETKAHLKRDRFAAHFLWTGGDELPLLVRAEYGSATDGQADKADLKRDGWYGTVLYTFEKRFQLGVRYDVYDKNKDVDGAKVKTLTAGFHYLVKGKNMNLKLDWFSVKEEGRKVSGVLDESYNQFVLAAQVAF